MNAKGKPAGLPDEYSEIWAALKQADEESASRQVLARSLGLSTHTIQRILVTGDVPTFPETTNTRVVRSWARILTRLAYHFGREPRRWIEMIGIPWDQEISRAADGVLKRLRDRETGRPGRMPPDTGEPSAGSRIRPHWPDCIRIGLVDRPPFSSLLPAFSTSFIEVYVRRLFMAIAPESRLRFQALDEQEVISGLIGPGASLDLGLAVVDTVHRRFLGLEFLAIPGWRIRLAAVTVRRSQDTRHPPTWRAATSQTGFGDHFFLVLGDDLAGFFLAGQCGIPTERLLVRNMSDPDAIARTL